jgi:hypothetical protein
MKVIKANRFSRSFPKQIKCQRVVDEYGFAYGKDHDFCGSELEVDMEDIKKHKWSKYPDYKGVDYGVICPVCGKFVVINEKEIPNGILLNAEEVYLRK